VLSRALAGLVQAEHRSCGDARKRPNSDFWEHIRRVLPIFDNRWLNFAV
jgi:hypothetical protein